MTGYHTALKMIQLPLYKTTQSHNGQISSILFKDLNFKGKVNLKIRTAGILRGEGHTEGFRDTVIFLNWVVRTLVCVLLLFFILYKFCKYPFIHAKFTFEFAKIKSYWKNKIFRIIY